VCGHAGAEVCITIIDTIILTNYTYLIRRLYIRYIYSVLERSAVMLSSTYIEARFTLALPAQGRTVMGRLAHARYHNNRHTYTD
jgi:hypothetical protein